MRGNYFEMPLYYRQIEKPKHKTLMMNTKQSNRRTTQINDETEWKRNVRHNNTLTTDLFDRGWIIIIHFWIVNFNFRCTIKHSFEIPSNAFIRECWTFPIWKRSNQVSFSKFGIYAPTICFFSFKLYSLLLFIYLYLFFIPFAFSRDEHAFVYSEMDSR